MDFENCFYIGLFIGTTLGVLIVKSILSLVFKVVFKKWAAENFSKKTSILYVIAFIIMAFVGMKGNEDTEYEGLPFTVLYLCSAILLLSLELWTHSKKIKAKALQNDTPKDITSSHGDLK